MGEFVTLTTADGHQLSAWRSAPQGKPRAALVVIQEIFGVNSHIRDVTDRFAREGYLAIAPALFDRFERNYESGYNPDEIARGREAAGKLVPDLILKDVEAARAAVASAGKVGIVGYCLGGTVAWRAACHLTMDAAVCYYGGGIAGLATEKPHCPVIMHFGKQDANIPLSAVEQVRAAQPDVPIYLYDAGHGFSCDQRGSFDKPSHELAWTRTLAFFTEKLG